MVIFRKHGPGDNSFGGNPFGVPVKNSNLLHAGNGFAVQKASGVLTQSFKLDFEDLSPYNHTVDRILEEIHLHPLYVKLRHKNHIAIRIPPQNPCEMYLQALREFIFERQGVLGEGWRVEFKEGVSNGETCPVYCSPDGKKFESMSEVACYVGLVKVAEGLPAEDSESEFQKLNDALPVQYEDFFVLSVGRIDARPSYHDVNQIWPVGYRACWHDKVTGSLFICDVSDGKDSGPVFIVKRQSCSVSPIPNGSTVLHKTDSGKSNNHQNYFISDDVASDVMSNDDDCSVLMFLSDRSPPKEHDIASCLGIGSSNSFDVPNSNSVQFETMPLCDGWGDAFSNNSVLGDEIGEFSIEESSPSSAWRVASKKLIDSCREIYKRTGSLKFFCKHATTGTCAFYGGLMNEKKNGKIIQLAKYCGLSNSVNIPSVICTDSAFETTSEELLKWLDQDRFGLDVGFVQEMLEQLPGVQACPRYVFLSERSSYSSSVAVGNGLLAVKTQSGALVTGLSKNCERSRIQVVEESVMNDCCLPPGKPLSSRLPPQLVGDVLQVWEFLGRFSECLGLQEPCSFEELEEELINPWKDGLKLVDKFGTLNHGNQDTKLVRADGTGGPILYSSIECGSKVSMGSPYTFMPVETEAMKEAAQAKLASTTYDRCTGSTLAKAHYSLLNVLLGELQAKVDPHFDVGETKSKRGRRKDTNCWIAANRNKLNMLPCNELTWPELARRYILAVVFMDGNLDSAEITIRESGKVFRCLQGDGGLLCGSVTGVAGIEADALLLAEAMKKIYGSLNRGRDILTIDDVVSDETTPRTRVSVNDGIVPEWVLSLEPVRKLPTNVGARIRTCINNALDKGPPKWAKEILEHSISKEVYKGNASGPTKKAVLALLAEVYGEGSQQKPDVEKKKNKKLISISKIIMKQCRIVLRQAAAADGEKIFCNLLGRKLLSIIDNDDEGILGLPAMVSRPLDFRTIDLRLAAGAYGGSHEAFVEDVRELWTAVRIAFKDQPNLVELAETLSHNFELLYEKEVVGLYQTLLEYSVSEYPSAESKKEIYDFLVSVHEVPKAPWEEGVCKICGVDKDDDSVLLCDTCDAEYHTYCLNPPLSRIPQGNWYCPTCVAGKHVVRNASECTRLHFQRPKKFLGEASGERFDCLAHLVAGMYEREYWELSVEERTFLLKFLCDELLNSALIRQHLERCAEESADWQQKLRPLSVELRNLKYKEQALVAEAAKGDKISLKAVRDIGTEESKANARPNKEKFGRWLPTSSDRNDYAGASSDDLQLDSPQNCANTSLHNLEKNNSCDSQMLEPVDSEGQSVDAQPAVNDCMLPENTFAHVDSQIHNGTSQQEWFPSLNLPQQEVISLGRENVFCGKLENTVGDFIPSTPPDEQRAPLDTRSTTHIYEHVSSTAVSKPNSDGLVLSSVRNKISVLQNSIACIETKIHKLSLRREFLGIDPAGRLYWVLTKAGTHSCIIVSTNLAVQQRGKLACCSFTSSGLTTSAPYAINSCWTQAASSSSCSFGHQLSEPYPICSPWVCYQSDTEIEDLVDYLKDNEPRGRELTNSILHWQKLRFQGSKERIQEEMGGHRVALLQHTSSENSAFTDFLTTKAASLLETKCGPCFEPKTAEFLKKQGSRKVKTTAGEKLYRCVCLEPVWPSRHHCLSCHRTFLTDAELQGHDEGKCNSVLSASSKLKNSDAFKGKAIMQCDADEPDIVDASKGGYPEFSSGLIRYDFDGLLFPFDFEDIPFDFEDICSKFIVENSSKELVQEIGLIGSKGVPSFVPSISPNLNNAALVPPQEDVGVQVDNPKADESIACSQEENMTTVAGDDTLRHANSPRGFAEAKLTGTLAADKPKMECLEQKDKKSSLQGCAPGLRDGNCCIVSKSALRPFLGKASHIFRRLKINLLDMDAVLPEAALRPSKAQLERRWAWRAFVKSAQTIFEMVQAIIVFQDMIKAEYLKNMWWYWSSFSATAQISSLSSLALYIYSLDAVIDYEKIYSDMDSLEPNRKPGQKQEPKLGRKPNKRRKESED